MKRKVQAQRKFAQGAYIPPLNNSSTAKSEAPAPLKEGRRTAIVHSNLSARNLLDIVSFQNIHAHSKPVVVLERLTPKENAVPTTNGHEAIKSPPSQTMPARAKMRRMSLVVSGNMKLRSRKNKIKRVLPLRRGRRVTKPDLKMRLKKVWVASNSDFEDDRPLKYLKRTTPPENEGRQTRSSMNSDRSTPLYGNVERPTRVLITPAKHISETETDLEDDESMRLAYSDSEIEESGRVTRSITMTEKRRLAESSSARAPKEPRTSAFKEPALPTRFNRSSEPVAAVSLDQTQNVKESVDAARQSPAQNINEPVPATIQEPTQNINELVSATDQGPIQNINEPTPATCQGPIQNFNEKNAVPSTSQGPVQYIESNHLIVMSQDPDQCCESPCQSSTNEEQNEQQNQEDCSNPSANQGLSHDAGFNNSQQFQGLAGNMQAGFINQSYGVVPPNQMCGNIAGNISFSYVPIGNVAGTQAFTYASTSQGATGNLAGNMSFTSVPGQVPFGNIAGNQFAYVPPVGNLAGNQTFGFIPPNVGSGNLTDPVGQSFAYASNGQGPSNLSGYIPSRFPFVPSGQGPPFQAFNHRHWKMLYDSMGIKHWMNYNSERTRREREALGLPPDLPPCPSEKLRTVKDVVNATPAMLDNRCFLCRSCERVDLVKELAVVLTRSLRSADLGHSNDVYEFNAEDDPTNPLPFSGHRRRNPNQERDTNAPAASGDDEQPLYLDLQKDSPHIIEVTSVTIPNTNKKILKAKLMPKSQAQTTEDFSLIEHENLLDQLLQTLIVNQKKDSDQDPHVDSSKSDPANASGSNQEEGARKTRGRLNTALSSKSNEPQPSTSRAPVTPLPSTIVQPQPSTSKVHIAPVPPTVPEAQSSACNTPQPQSITPQPSTSSEPQPSTCNTPQPLDVQMEDEPPARPEPSKTSRRHNTRSSDDPGRARPDKTAKLLEAPTFYPTEAEFTDPIAYIEKIAPMASKYGLCKIVAPASFKPKCVLGDDLKFNVQNHYIARLFSRWGPAAREISAMRAYLATQNINFLRVPLLESLEVNLPKLYSVVQRNGGLKAVMEKKRWGRVAEEMRFSKGPNVEKLLDSYYVKYMLPYDTASNHERTTIMTAVEKCWNKKHKKLVQWASNPLHHQKKLLGESDSSDEDVTDDSMERALHEAEECVVAGRPMNLTTFKKVAAHAMSIYMGNPNATVEEIEKEYWRLVLFGTEHVCVNAASIDTTASGYGFSKSKTEAQGKHPWNLKMLSNSTNNLLRSLSGVVGVTVPTLHLGMVFSTYCWHRDPHGLPWIEYVHQGPPKIWYGIPEEQSDNFRSAVEAHCPTSCQNKYIWLSSDITMIPPKLLLEHKVTLSHTQQNPGEFIIVFPKAYSCSISTGFTVSESVYFATNSWLKTVHEVFRELRASCEPATFTLEQLLLALAKDPRSSFGVLHTAHSLLSTIVDEEMRLRNELSEKGIRVRCRNLTKQRTGAAWNVREEAECQICRCTLYLSKVTGVLSKKSDLCLLHAQRMLETRRYNANMIARMETVLFYTERQLNEIMTNLKKRLVR